MLYQFEEPMTAKEWEALDAADAQEAAARQNVKAGYITVNELVGTEQPNNRYYGKTKAEVFLHIWADEYGFTPSLADLQPACSSAVSGNDDRFNVQMPDGSVVHVERRIKEEMQARDKDGNVVLTVR